MNHDDASYIASLLYKRLSGTITSDEEVVLQKWLKENSANEAFAQQIEEDDFTKEIARRSPRYLSGLREELYAKIQQATGIERALSTGEAKVVPMQAKSRNRRPVLAYMRSNVVRVAVMLLIIAGVGALWIFLQRDHASTKTVKTIAVNNEIPPGGNRATLTLSDGSTIVLDSANIGTIAQQQNVAISKSAAGTVQYHVKGSGATSAMNTLSTPKGGQYKLVLPDGSKVWLNAASSITFPTQFATQERRVSITGEAYFEIAADAARPFYVKAKETDVKVLGTSFNINAYDDESEIATTLLIGAVMVSVGSRSQRLQPGQQAQSKGEELLLQKNIDTEAVVAWKEGYFNFQDMRLQAVMRQLERWYGIEVAYEGAVHNIAFYGKLSKDLTLQETLEGMAKTGLHFRLEGHRLIVTP
ncbi:FecR family protein [Pinibacter aurantiacus]|uniref:FecR domain-containing protein n=1 Tax=Pinibacter aurantiacus TaxID=2851599 RepID=A0A9E2W8Y5_9BACT|nr:FecR family protein [Pinibacter aurantiacus]MBV4358892.1 FecR domain-containing protein [Pinibacter aurantiacus]